METDVVSIALALASFLFFFSPTAWGEFTEPLDEPAPCLHTFSANTGEVTSLTDDEHVRADLLNGDLFLQLGELVQFHTNADVNLMFGLHYSSANGTAGTLGSGWRHTYDIVVNYSYNGGSPILSLTGPLGRTLPFTNPGSGWISQPSFGAYLTATVLGTPSNPIGFVVTDRWGRTLNFDSTGVLTSITDYFGRITTLAYSGGLLASVTDPFGNSVSLSYSGGLLSSVADNTLSGSPVYLQFNYDGSKRLTTVTEGFSPGPFATYSFTYTGTTWLLDTYTDPDSGVHSFGFTSSALTSITDPLSNTVSISYGSTTATVTDRCGNTWTYYFSTTVGALIQLDFPSLGGTVYRLTQSFDSSRNMVSRAEPGLGTWSYSYDSSGNMLSRSTSFTWNSVVETVGESWTYNSQNLPVTYTDGNGNTWNFDWFGPGRLASVVCPDDNPASPSHASAITYDANGFPNSWTDYIGNVWTLSYSSGRLVSLTTPLSNTFSRTYDNRGNLASQTTPLGNTTAYSYDNLYHLFSASEPFDASGNAVTSYSYSSYGRLSSWTDAVSSAFSYTRDAAGRITTFTDALTNSRAFSYDGEGRLITFTDKRANTWAYTRDSWGRPLTLTDPNTNNYTYSYGFSPFSRTVTDRSGVVLTYTNDPAGRLRAVTDALGNSIGYKVDGAGNVTGITDQRSNTTTRTYDSLNRLISQTDPRSFSYVYDYDFNGNMTSWTNRNGGIYVNAFDAENRITSHTMPDSSIRTYEYDSDSRLTGFTNELGGVLSLSYNAGGKLVTMTYPNGNVNSYAWDRAGRIQSGSDSISSLFSFTRDALGRITAVSIPNGSAENFSYDADGNMTSYSDNNGNVWSYTWDAAGDLIGIVNPRGGNTTLSRDPEGRLASRLDPSGTFSEWLYDTRGLLSAYGPNLGRMTFSYDAAGNLVSRTDPQGNAWSFGYDGRNQRTSVTDPLSNTTSYEYDGEGNIISVTDPRSNTTSFLYDSMSRMTSATDPLGNTEFWTYTAMQPLTRTDRNGRITTYSYTSAGPVSSITFYDPFNPGSNLTRNFDYDARYRCVSENGPYLSIARTFDSCDNPVSESWTPTGFGSSSTLSRTFDNNGNVTAINDFSGRNITYTYDSLDLCTELNDGGNITTFSYDLAGLMLQRVMPSGQYVDYSYAPGTNLVSTLEVFDSFNNLQDRQTYSYDAMLNVTGVSSLRGWSVNYGYDSKYRLTSEIRSGSNPYTRSFTYDTTDNMTTETVNGTTTTYTYDARNSLTQEVTGGVPIAYNYDSNANLISDSNGNSYTYDHYDRLAGYSNGGGVQYRYMHPYEDIRVIRETYTGGSLSATDFYFYDGMYKLNEYYKPFGGSPSLTRGFSYTDENGLTGLTIPSGMGGSGYYNYIEDALDNVYALTDTAQVFRNVYEYSGFGTLVNSGGLNPLTDRFRYKESQIDTESGAYFMHARMFAPNVKRYTSARPYRYFSYGDYVFTENRPNALSPNNGLHEDYAQSAPEMRPDCSLPPLLPAIGRQNVTAFSASPMQWRHPLPLYLQRFASEGFDNVTDLANRPRELMKQYFDQLNNDLAFASPPQGYIDFGRPYRPLSTDDDMYPYLVGDTFSRYRTGSTGSW
ncbi:MAG: DUF6531 domain-containing protein [Planctomycetota bacterium]|nr:DUF6531 domain-containing protein [Planctomycetota bacterium]